MRSSGSASKSTQHERFYSDRGTIVIPSQAPPPIYQSINKLVNQSIEQHTGAVVQVNSVDQRIGWFFVIYLFFCHLYICYLMTRKLPRCSNRTHLSIYAKHDTFKPISSIPKRINSSFRVM